MSSKANAQNYYQKMVELMKNKKALKTIQPMLDYKLYEENPYEQYRLILALMEGINWSFLFTKTNTKESKEYVKVSYLGKKLKLLSQQENFIDYFSLTLLRSSCQEILYQNLEKFYLVMKLDFNFQIILTTSLAFQTQNQEMKKKAFKILLDLLEKYEEIGKPLDYPQNFILFFAKFYKVNKEEFKDHKKQIKYFFESSQENLKDIKIKSLLTLNEPYYFNKEANYIDNFSSEYINYLHQQIPLDSLIKELGPQISENDEKLSQIFVNYQNVEIKDIFITSLMMLKANYDFSIKQENQAINDQTIAQVTFAFLNSKQFQVDSAFKKANEQKIVNEWNIEQFIKSVKNFYQKKINWTDFFRILININDDIFGEYENQIFFEQFFKFLELIKDCTGIQTPPDLLYTRWKNPLNQTAFFYYLFKEIQSNPLNIQNILDKERNLTLADFPKLVQTKILELSDLMQNKIPLKLLIELSNKNDYYEQTKILIEKNVKSNFEGMFILLISLEINMGNFLLTEILEKMVISILNSSTTLADLIECFFNINQKYLAYIFFRICKAENNFLYLSKILDYSQTIKDFFIPLTQTEYHYFSISLSLLAVKREFLRLENWVEGRLLQGDIQWVEEFMKYIQNKILQPLSNYSNPNKALVDEVLDKSQITLNGLAIIFENFFLNNRFTNHIPKKIKEKIKEFYDKIQIYIPELSQVCTNDTEKQANRILEELYFGYITIDEFIKKVLSLKQSQNNRDQEILSCIIINIIDEFRFYQTFPEKELLITSDIFGQFIAQQVIDGKILIVFLKALSDALQKDGKMFAFGLRAINHFILDTSLEINIEFYKLLFANSKLRSKEFKLLYQLYHKLQQENKHIQISSEQIEQIKQKIAQFENAKIQQKAEKEKQEKIEKSEKKTLKQRLQVASMKYQEKSLMELLKQNFQNLDKMIKLDKKIKEKIIFWMNSAEDKKTEIKDFISLVDSGAKIQWFSAYLVFDRIPFEHQNQITYKKLIIKSNIKELYYQVQKRTMLLMNNLMDFLITKEELQSSEFNIARHCGKWACQITLMCNRPIVLKDFDLKEKIHKALVEQKIQNVMPTVCSFLQQIDKKSFFNIKVPYVNSLIDVLREIFSFDWIPNNIKVQIDLLFNKLEISQPEIYKFNYIKKKKNVKKQAIKKKNIFQMKRSLQEMVKLDPNGFSEEIQQKCQVDLRQLIAMAINSSIEDIIWPVLNRSVSNTLETTRELIIKDFVAEPDDKKILNAAEAMITNLTWYIALVTCKEPLRVQITQHLNNYISMQTQLDEMTIKSMSENLSNINLNLACDIVKNIVVENALNEIRKDIKLKNEIRKRIEFKESQREFQSESLSQLEASLPEELNPRKNNENLYKIEIYNKVKNSQQNQTSGDQSQYIWPSPISQQQKTNLEEKQIVDLLMQIENEIQNPNNLEKMKTIHNIYSQLSKILQSTKNIENLIFPQAEYVLKKLFFRPSNTLSMEILKYYSDVLIIYSNVNPKLPKMITKWIFQLQEQIFRHHLISVFLRRNLLHLREFDQSYAQILKQNNLNALNCIVLVLKSLVIEDKIFSIYSFPQILEEITKIGKTNLIEKVSLEVSIFVKNLIDFIENTNKINSSMFRLTNLEPEYKKLFQDVSEYFKILNKEIYRAVCKTLRSWMKAENESEHLAIIQNFQKSLIHDNEKSLIIFFCYIFEISVNKSLQNLANDLQQFKNLEYKYIDSITRLITMLIKYSQESTYYFEKILTSLIIVLTKKHFYDVEFQFNQKSFFRIIFNILYDINSGEFVNNENLDKFSVVLVQTLHILQPIKYPAFSFAWLQLISSKFLVQTLLKKDNHEIWNHYTILIVDLMTFYRDIFCIQYLTNEEMKMFYKGTLRILLILIHDFPDFLCEQSFVILEEIPQNFKQFRNIVLSAFPKNLKMPNPFSTNSQTLDLELEFQNLPVLSQKIEARINSHNLHSILINFIKKIDSAESQNESLNQILEKFYIYGYKNSVQLNILLLESFVVYVPQFLFSNIYNTQNQQSFENYQKQSYNLFIRILLKEDYNLREACINAILNNLRYPNYITFYFINLIILIFEQLEDHVMFEQILTNLLSRLTIEKPHPWGILSLTYKLMYESNFINKQYYKQNEQYVSEMVRIAFKYGKIEKAINYQIN